MTYGRIALIPLILLFLYIPFDWAAWTALVFYALACLTDFLDGYLARKLKQISDIGIFLDPIADKILVGALFVVLVDVGRINGFWVLPALVIIIREFLISGLREYLGPKNVQMPVSQLAKWKTATQMVALGFLVGGNAIFPGMLLLGQLTLTGAAVLTVITGWNYLKVGLDHMLKEDEAKKNV